MDPVELPTATIIRSGRAAVRWSAAGAVVCVLVFLALSSREIALPALHEDVTISAVAAMRIITGQPQASEGWYPIRFGGRKWPVLLTPVIGATVSYVVSPSLWWSGINVAAFRWGLICWGAVGIWIIWWCAKCIVGDRLALLTAMLVAIHPSYILWCRDGFADVLAIPLLGGILGLVWSWYRCGAVSRLYWASALLGVGFWSRSIFLLAPFTAAAATAVLFGRTWLDRCRSARITIDQRLMIGYVFVLGAAGRLWYHYHTTSLDPYAMAVWWKGYWPVLIDYPDRLLQTIRMFWLMSTGGWSAGSVDYMGGPSNFLVLPMLLVAVPVAMALSATGRGSDTQRRIAWLGCVGLLMLLLLPFAPQQLNAYNLMLLIPISQLIIALWLFEQWRIQSGARRWSVALLTIALVSINLATMVGYRLAAVRTGGAGDFSDAIYACARDLDGARVSSPLACDWGFRHRLIFLTEGRVQPLELVQPKNLKDQLATQLTLVVSQFEQWVRDAQAKRTSTKPTETGLRAALDHSLDLMGRRVSPEIVQRDVQRIEQRFRRELENPDQVYLFRVDASAGAARYDAFSQMVHDAGKQVRLERLYRQRDGVPVLAIYSVASVYRFLDHLVAAIVQCRQSEDVQVTVSAIGTDQRQALVMQPSSEARFRMRLPRRAILRFSTGIPEHCWTVGDGASGSVTLVLNGEEQVLFEQYLNPQSHLDDRRWFEHRIDLTPYADQEVEIVLRTYPGREIGVVGGDYNADWFSWTDLHVTQSSRLLH